MCVEVATPNLYAVSQRNCRQAPDTRMTDMGRRSGCSSSNDDVESPGLSRCSIRRAKTPRDGGTAPRRTQEEGGYRMDTHDERTAHRCDNCHTEGPTAR